MSLARHALFSLILSLTLVSPAQTGAATEPDCWKLLPEAQVDGSGVFLDQVAAPCGLTKPLPHLRLARAPQIGLTNVFTRSEIAGVAQACVLGLVMTNWTGPQEVRVSRRARVLEDSDLLDLLTAALQKEYVKDQGELELHLVHAWPRPQVPDEPLTLKVSDVPAMGITPSFIPTIELWAGKERLGNWQVPVQASLWRDIPVAQSTLQRGQLLNGANIALERADILVLRDVFLNFPTVNDSLELNESVSAGRPILNREVRVRPLVKRGQLVEGVFEEGTLAISLMVETLEDGALGQTVRVRNPITHRELFGKVENEKTIRIIL